MVLFRIIVIIAVVFIIHLFFYSRVPFVAVVVLSLELYFEAAENILC